MLALIKRRQFLFPFLACFVFVLLVSYFSLAHNRRRPSVSANLASKNLAAGEPVVSSSHSASLDSDNDGIPDAAELQSFMDRENFRRWFTLIAEAQFYQLSEQWNAEQRDCAGLVRFALREAL